ncbi:hypothetical protein [Xylanimonas protaetiae]|uniref:Uncharacterized protein n=1 Tax=Xylanimonas protaetiae TaxID=2509457 RepID=A0A4P6F388_9MICO|nr:hypothetical protein [Xylanimonas protaetiae]QAY68629.1 hypothetical protein ET471_00015 [Xylanimonas protaetiae]
MTAALLGDVEHLRHLLTDLATNPTRSWARDPEAADLMRFCARKYAGLARKYGQSPHDAAVAAFFELRRPSLAAKRDPWAYVTTAVESNLKANQLADERLCSERDARHRQATPVHEAKRLDDGGWSVLSDALPVTPAADSVVRTVVGRVEPGEATRALDVAVYLLATYGWPVDVARVAVDYVSDRLANCGGRRRAYTYLRRDRHALVLLDLPHRSWLALLTALLGDPGQPETSDAGRGLLLRALLGEGNDTLSADPVLRAVLNGGAPTSATAVEVSRV